MKLSYRAQDLLPHIRIVSDPEERSHTVHCRLLSIDVVMNTGEVLREASVETRLMTRQSSYGVIFPGGVTTNGSIHTTASHLANLVLHNRRGDCQFSYALSTPRYRIAAEATPGRDAAAYRELTDTFRALITDDHLAVKEIATWLDLEACQQQYKFRRRELIRHSDNVNRWHRGSYICGYDPTQTEKTSDTAGGFDPCTHTVQSPCHGSPPD